MKRLLLCLSSFLMLAGCATQDTAELTPTPAAPAATPAVSIEDACRSAVAQMANRDLKDTSIIDSQASRAGTAVTIKLKRANRPWSCIAGPDGAITNVTYMGEG